ncbi:copper-transporting ATPase PAA1, chloroplastic-like [Pyrus x bretschneideri]|uniref:copper-transporting ATPase PAA1, chloroplastic-like n=1 Tax=Pyrus x bretschneideri TaxID=225117 RepID=UPI00202FF499|nr:copper-transporting ATPase PAA1, chloroplastic-like [Pyrus x bretschneideri]XP_048433634.1 copper-transporting ATPase PAA1, chloroplastic-like [Pyrus x bretschneideri]
MCRNPSLLSQLRLHLTVAVLYQLLRTKRFLLGLWNGFKGMELPFEEVEAHTSQSIVYVGIDSTLAGLIYFEDQIRVDAGQVVKSLSKQGIDVYMLSGDKSNNAEYVAFVVGIPKEKLLDALELSRLTMKQNLDVQSSNPDAIT